MTAIPAARWTTRRTEKADRLAKASTFVQGKIVPTARIIDLLQCAIRSGDRVVLEGNNQKQADFLSRSPAQVDPDLINGLHLVLSSISRPEHLNLFESGIATLCDFAYAGPQATRVAALLDDGTVKVGAIDTYLELYGLGTLDLDDGGSEGTQQFPAQRSCPHR